MTATVIIPAAGSGTRMGGGSNKLFLSLGGKPVLEWSLEVFQAHPGISEILLVVREQDIPVIQSDYNLLNKFSKVNHIIAGGETRQDSVRIGLEHFAGAPPEYVLVHDGARPFCSEALISRIITALGSGIAVVPMLPIHDTVRKVTEELTQVLDRSNLYRSQTPQGFHFMPLLTAHRDAKKSGVMSTDDGQIMEWKGHHVVGVAGDEQNIKLTTPMDMKFLESWLASLD